MADDDTELGALLVLLHGAGAPFQTVQADYRIWWHLERSHEAFVADHDERKRRGGSGTMFQVHGSEPAPEEEQETTRIWRAGDRAREEQHGGQRDGYYAVADGPLWWMWDHRMGAMSNQDDPSVGSGVGQQLEIMLDPTPLLSALRFRASGTSEVAGRATVSADATPRPQDPRFGPSFRLHELGTGADRYRLEVDRERGVLLAVTALRDGQPFRRTTAIAVAFDEPIAEEIFRFTPPEGEEIQTSRGRSRVQHLTLTEAQQRASFTVLMPDRVPESWQVHCVFVDASDRPPSPPQVSLNYRSDDGHESVSISQMALADRSSHHYENMINSGDWEAITRNGTTVKVRRGGSQSQAHIERDGTFAFLVSDNLAADQLATLATGLRPAPASSSI